jgi:biotin synthase
MTTNLKAQPVHLPSRQPPRGATGPWSVAQLLALLEQPFMVLVQQAHEVHCRHFPQGDIELASLLSVKTGGCAEDCGYCPQSAHHDTGVAATKLMGVDEVLANARAAKEAGASRFCMGAAWRAPNDRDLGKVAELVRGVHALGLETCATLGMLQPTQARALAEAGLKVCCGGIVGLGETRAQRAGLLAELANLDPQPESVPINNLVRVAGTPMADNEPVDPFEVVRMIAAARIAMPRSRVRLSAGRRELGDGIQALCFMAGANSIFYGDKLLVTGNPEVEDDRALLRRLDLPVTSEITP